MESFCSTIPHLSSIHYLLDIFPLFSWLLECNHGEIQSTIQQQCLQLLLKVCSSFQTQNEIEVFYIIYYPY